jgi:hypothetical protein
MQLYKHSVIWIIIISNLRLKSDVVFRLNECNMWYELLLHNKLLHNKICGDQNQQFAQLLVAKEYLISS